MTYITWNMSNWITVCLMVAVGGLVLGALGASTIKLTGLGLSASVSAATPTAGQSST